MRCMRRAHGDDPAVVDDGHAVAEPLRLVHVVRGQEHGRPPALKLVHDVPDLPPRLRVEAGRGLVEEQQLRVADQRAGHGQALLLPAGEGAHARLRLLRELDLAGSPRPGRGPRR